jgi:hypothetical protein
VADNLTTQGATPATPPVGTGVATRLVTYGGSAGQSIAPVGLVVFQGADGAKTVFDLGACSTAHLVAAATTNPTSVKASAGLLVGVRIFNLRATPIYVKFHNTAGAPVAGVGVVYTVAVQAGMSRDVLIPFGRYFSTGIAFTIVTGIADADANAVAANDCVVDVEYN